MIFSYKMLKWHKKQFSWGLSIKDVRPTPRGGVCENRIKPDARERGSTDFGGPKMEKMGVQSTIFTRIFRRVRRYYLSDDGGTREGRGAIGRTSRTYNVQVVISPLYSPLSTPHPQCSCIFQSLEYYENSSILTYFSKCGSAV